MTITSQLSIECRGPKNGVPESIATEPTQALLFEDYLTYSEGTIVYIFAHQIRDKCCNLSNSGWKLLTPIVNDNKTYFSILLVLIIHYIIMGGTLVGEPLMLIRDYFSQTYLIEAPGV